MINLLYVFLLSLWFCFLFYGTKLGIGVTLFILPLSILIYYTLKKTNNIHNKKGLLIFIPIILLSMTYGIFDNAFFKVVNFFIIIGLFILLYIMTIKPTFRMINIFGDVIDILLTPFEYIKEVKNDTIAKLSNKLHMKEKTKQKLKSFFIALPIIIIILILLSSADLIFNNLMNSIFNVPKNIIKNINISEIILRIIMIIVFFFYFSGTLYYLISNYKNEDQEQEEKPKKVQTDTIKILLISLNIIYFIFDIIQIKSLIFHSVGETITYANYARQGFFQLMVVSFINLCVILYSKRYNNKKDNNKIKVLSIIMVFLTFIIIISSFLRMYMYEEHYGYTLLRILVYFALITETICLLPTIIFIIKEKFNITKSFMIIIITMYVILNYINIDSLIAYRNIELYQTKKDIDISYLMNNHADNIPQLIRFSKKVKDKDTKWILKEYLKEQEYEMKDFREWNLSKMIAKQKLESVNENG